MTRSGEPSRDKPPAAAAWTATVGQLASAGRPVFMVGVHRRCGSNYVADALRLSPAFQDPAPLAEDYVLQYSPLLSQYVEQTAEEQYRKRFDDQEPYEACKAAMLRQLGGGILAFLCGHLEPGRRLFTKTPDPWNLKNFFRLFPEALLIILVRDGRDIVESSKLSWPSQSYAHWMKAWAKGASEVLDFVHGEGRPWHERWRLVRYEDVLNSREEMSNLLAFVGISTEEFPWDRFEQLPLRGSSVHRDGAEQLHWKPVERPKDFNPLGRWHNWSRWRRWQFKRLAGRELIELGYTEDNRW